MAELAGLESLADREDHQRQRGDAGDRSDVVPDCPGPEVLRPDLAPRRTVRWCRLEPVVERHIADEGYDEHPKYIGCASYESREAPHGSAFQHRQDNERDAS